MSECPLPCPPLWHQVPETCLGWARQGQSDTDHVFASSFVAAAAQPPAFSPCCPAAAPSALSLICLSFPQLPLDPDTKVFFCPVPPVPCVLVPLYGWWCCGAPPRRLVHGTCCAASGGHCGLLIVSRVRGRKERKTGGRIGDLGFSESGRSCGKTGRDRWTTSWMDGGVLDCDAHKRGNVLWGRVPTHSRGSPRMLARLLRRAHTGAPHLCPSVPLPCPPLWHQVPETCLGWARRGQSDTDECLAVRLSQQPPNHQHSRPAALLLLLPFLLHRGWSAPRAALPQEEQRREAGTDNRRRQHAPSVRLRACSPGL